MRSQKRALASNAADARMELCLGESVGAFVVEISKDFSVCRRFCGSGCPRAAYSLWVHRLGLHHPYVVPPWFALLYSLSRYPQPVSSTPTFKDFFKVMSLKLPAAARPSMSESSSASA